jgi:hypothetical protein
MHVTAGASAGRCGRSLERLHGNGAHFCGAWLAVRKVLVLQHIIHACHEMAG